MATKLQELENAFNSLDKLVRQVGEEWFYPEGWAEALRALEDERAEENKRQAAGGIKFPPGYGLQ